MPGSQHNAAVFAAVPGYHVLPASLAGVLRFPSVSASAGEQMHVRTAMKYPYSSATLLLALVLISLPVVAAVEDATQIDPVVVTATRTAETADQTLAPVTVVDRDEIERRQSLTTVDILRGLPGLPSAIPAVRDDRPISFCAAPTPIKPCFWWMASRLAPPPLARVRFRTFQWNRSSVSRWCADLAPACMARKRQVA